MDIEAKDDGNLGEWEREIINPNGDIVAVDEIMICNRQIFHYIKDYKTKELIFTKQFSLDSKRHLLFEFEEGQDGEYNLLIKETSLKQRKQLLS